MLLPPTLLICQNTACRRAGSAELLAAFETATITPITPIGCRCLGQCGNGPVVLVMPEQTWYYQVHPDEIPSILRQHLRKLDRSPEPNLE